MAVSVVVLLRGVRHSFAQEPHLQAVELAEQPDCCLLLLSIALRLPQGAVADIDVHAPVDFDNNV